MVLMSKMFIKEINHCYQCPSLKRVDNYRLKCDIANKEFNDTVYATDKIQDWCPLENVIKEN